jgi:hypothetical protein
VARLWPDLRTGRGKRDIRYELLRKNYAKDYAKNDKEIPEADPKESDE